MCMVNKTNFVEVFMFKTKFLAFKIQNPYFKHMILSWFFPNIIYTILRDQVFGMCGVCIPSFKTLIQCYCFCMLSEKTQAGCSPLVQYKTK